MSEPLPRNPEIMRPDDTGLLVVDLQDRLLAVQPLQQRIAWNVRRLVDGARVFNLRTAVTEQYPEKLGPTTTLVAERLGLADGKRAFSKRAFSCGECGDLFAEWRETGIHRVLVCGIEAHVCVQQTVLDLLAAGFQVNVAVNAIGSRFSVDYKTALRRIEAAGGLLTTTEAALFEWCERAGTAEFKQISELAKEKAPG